MQNATRNAVATAVALALLPFSSFGSSHREAPNITKLPAVDSTDFYMFMSYESGRNGYVTFLANYIPLQDPYGGPNYFALDPAARYEIHIDNNGDAREDLTFRFSFTNKLANSNTGIALTVGGDQVAIPLKNVGPISASDQSQLNFLESYTLDLVQGDSRTGTVQSVTNAGDGTATFGKPYDFIGLKTFGSVQGYEAYAAKFVYNVNIPGCSMPGRVFVGQRHEGFAVNLGRVFDLVNLVPVDGSVFPGGIMQDPNNNTVAGKNITTLALEIHSSCLKGSGNGVIGAWTTASLRQAQILNPQPTFSKPSVGGGPWTQVSRLSSPLVNELVIGIPDKDRFNASAPKDDAQFATYVTNPSFPAILDTLFRAPVNKTLGTSFSSIAPTNFPRQDLVTTFLTGFKGVNQLASVTPSEMERLNTGIAATPAASQNPMGVIGGDLAGYPNGRRPGDNVVDITLRVAMGRLCYPLMLNGSSVDLGLCKPSDANTGTAPYTDGAPVSAANFDMQFPYLQTPLPGASL
ncbi:MAG: DUF4331 domain-containing protein [Sinobacteraceae bacterium]|nr:DUF4331 domain-containing protein [Nevskiaceae bacterium]